VEPERTGLPAAVGYERFPAGAKRGRLQPVVTRDGHEGSLRLRQDALIYAGLFDGAESARLDIAPGRNGYVQVARGTITACGEKLGAGDGLAVPAGTIALESGIDAEVLVLDLPGTA
jgi:hypothetical protein